MPHTDLVIKRWFRTPQAADQRAARAAILLETAQKVQALAQKGARTPRGLGSGRKTGRLEEAIKIDGPAVSTTGKTVAVRIYVDESVPTSDYDGKSYASYQETGTGLRAEGEGSHNWIRPKRGRWHFMHWTQEGRGYRGRYITSVVIAKRRRKGKLIKTQAVYAIQVRGVQAKHYMRFARENKVIRAEHKAAMARLARQQLQF